MPRLARFTGVAAAVLLLAAVIVFIHPVTKPTGATFSATRQLTLQLGGSPSFPQLTREDAQQAPAPLSQPQRQPASPPTVSDSQLSGSSTPTPTPIPSASPEPSGAPQTVRSMPTSLPTPQPQAADQPAPAPTPAADPSVHDSDDPSANSEGE